MPKGIPKNGINKGWFKKGSIPKIPLEKISKGKFHYNWRGGKPKCLECGVLLSKRGYKRCKDCKGIPNKGKIPSKFIISRGKENINWKGGITSKNELQRTKFIQTMQRAVFERDNYKCVLCGRGGYLQVDHIQKWSEYPNLRFSMDNCRTLCMDCHYFITYGRKKT